ncbi:MAG: homoserine O-succinyltransferase [Prevotellaceae bacterium]|jgi:homoserine O-succinyltransferase|nr:homoserine O-succinyltransferase [Prevotellaceae bacterium]
MPVYIPCGLPAKEFLEKENIVLTDKQDGRNNVGSLKIAILNLMPFKIETETDLLRIISNSPLHIDIDLIAPDSHKSKNTPAEHIQKFYTNFSKISECRYDGLIVTGAPVEHLDFESVDYWDEFLRILDWARTSVKSSLFICWAAQAALYRYYGINKYPLNKKMFGIFEHRLNDPLNPLFRGFDDVFFAPHSRHTEIRREEIEKTPELGILSESDKAGVYIVQTLNRREIFVTGHSEYPPETLNNEYCRDLSKNLPIEMPQNYYLDDNPENQPLTRWRSHANLLFLNWLNYFVCD